jgi:uncharacterized protein YaaQ
MTPFLPIHSLMAAVVQEQDIDLAQRALEQLKIPVIHFSSTGGFLGRRNATLLIGLTSGMEQDVTACLRSTCRQRVEYLSIPLEGSPLPLPTPVPVSVGGATVFILPVERFEEF